MITKMLEHPIASVIIIFSIGGALSGVVREIMKPSVMRISASTKTPSPNYFSRRLSESLADAVYKEGHSILSKSCSDKSVEDTNPPTTEEDEEEKEEAVESKD